MRGRKIAYLSVALGLAVLLATGMKHRGKTIAFSTVAVGIVVLAGAGIIFSKDRILEKWYLRQLGTGGEAATKRALEMLARVGSEESLLKITEFHLHDFPDRHIPASFELIGVPLDAITVVHAIERRIGRQRAQAEMIRYMKNPKVQERTRLHFARIAIGATAPECLPDSQDVRQFRDAKPAAIEVLIQALSSKDKCCREGAAYALSLCGPEAAAAVPALKAVLKDTDELVSKPAAEALEKIQGKQDETQR